MFKKFIVLAVVLLSLSLPKTTSAAEVVTEEIICPQPYGGGVVCGVKTHVPVETGIAENLTLIGAGFILASGALLYFSKKANKAQL
jgi:LPXTG-motif cell wall-anchored protein